MNNRSKARAASLLVGAVFAAGLLGAPGAKAQEIICPGLPLVQCVILPEQGTGAVTAGPVRTFLEATGGAAGGGVSAGELFFQDLRVVDGCLVTRVKNRLVPLPIQFQTPDCQQPGELRALARSLRRR